MISMLMSIINGIAACLWGAGAVCVWPMMLFVCGQVAYSARIDPASRDLIAALLNPNEQERLVRGLTLRSSGASLQCSPPPSLSLSPSLALSLSFSLSLSLSLILPPTHPH
jgi:hypothetical protein